MATKINHFNYVSGVSEHVRAYALSMIKDRDWHGLSIISIWLNFFKNKKDENINILEYGCGTGQFTKLYIDWVREKYPDMKITFTGIDPWVNKSDFYNTDSTESLNITLIKDKAQNVKLDRKYDIIMLSHSIYYFKDEILKNDEFIQNLIQQLNPGGLLIIIAMTGEYNDLSTVVEYDGHYENMCTLQKFEKEVYPYCERGINDKGLYLTNTGAITFEQVTAALNTYGIDFSEYELEPAYLEFGELTDKWSELSDYTKAILKHITRGRSEHLNDSELDYLLKQLKGCTRIEENKYAIAHLSKIMIIENKN